MPTDGSATQRPPAELREELRLVEDELAQLRITVAALREQIGDRSGGTTDPADQAAALTAIEEQEALLGVLDARRAALRRGLGDA